MTPITEDQVVALMDGFAAREKDLFKARDAKAAEAKPARPTTASVLRFARKADVVALDAHRKATPRRTVSGMFFYIGGRSGAPA